MDTDSYVFVLYVCLLLFASIVFEMLSYTKHIVWVFGLV